MTDLNITPAKQHIITDADGKTKVAMAETLVLTEPRLVDSIDEERFADSKSEADEINDRNQRAAKAELLRQQHIESLEWDSLTRADKESALAREAVPVIKELTKAHRAACDAVEDFDAGEYNFKGQIKNRFAIMAEHPDVKRHVISGPGHFTHQMKAGVLTENGYKHVDNFHYNSVTGGFIAICIPADVPNLMHYANSEQAIAKADYEFNLEREKLIKARNRAAVELAAYKQDVKERLEAIEQEPTLRELLDIHVKKTKKV